MRLIKTTGPEEFSAELRRLALSRGGIGRAECGCIRVLPLAACTLWLGAVPLAHLLLTLPLASSFGPCAMLIDQSLVATGAAFLCLLCYRRLGLRSQVQVSPISTEQLPPEDPPRERSLLRRIWAFSVMQIAGIVSMNIAVGG